MAFKVAIILVICCSVALAQDTPSSTTTSTTASPDSSSTTTTTSNPSSSNTTCRPSVIGRLGNAYADTYQQESNSVNRSIDSVKNATEGIIEAKFNILKTGLDLGTILPRFGYNLFRG